MNLVSVQRLQRNPTVKQEIQLRGFSDSEDDENQNKKGIPVGFFTYPISQASDITAFRATTVPVGVDQAPMIEQTREIVHKFNTVYGETLVTPEMLLPENQSCMRLVGTDGKAKMSKSLGNCIYLSDTSKDIKKKVNSMYTDPEHLQITDPGHVEGNVVFAYLDAFCEPEHFSKFLPEYENLDAMKDHYRRGGLGDGTCKKFLFNIMEDFLQPMRERRAQYEQNIPLVYEILRKGSEAARAEAAKTLADVRKAMKIDYFDDADLIAEHTKKYQK
jgi:tryptophanyl-tRNA synthetase